MSKISRTVRGGEEVARNVRKGCRTLDDDDDDDDNRIITAILLEFFQNPVLAYYVPGRLAIVMN
jgi:hypothetical protein